MAPLVYACGARQNPEGPPLSAAVVRCTSDPAERARVRLQPVARKLSGALQHRWNVWQGELNLARCDGAAAERIRLLEQQRVTLEVTYTGELTTLVAAGLATGLAANGSVSGQLEIRRLLELAALPEVLSIEVQPVVQPNGGARGGRE